MPDELNKTEMNRPQPEHPEDELPPRLTPRSRFIFRVAIVLMAVSIGYLIWACISILSGPATSLECTWCLYLALIGFLSGLVTVFVILHEIRVHKVRKADRSEIEMRIQEAKHVQPRLTDSDRPANFTEKRIQLDEEVKRLEKLGPQGWTEFQVLPLECLLIDFLKLEDLKERARTGLAELKEYAEGDAFSYDVDNYYGFSKRIKDAISELGRIKGDNVDEKKDDKAEELRASLRGLLEHVADYELYWAKGSTIVSSIRVCGSVAVVVFMLMGILPLLCSTQGSARCCCRLDILDWGLLGVAGAVASALINLKNAQEVEIGHMSGKRELWRIVLGAPLGMLAGILVFSALAGGLIVLGSIVPNLKEPSFSDVYLSILWAVVAGMGLENVFQSVRKTVGY